jgi:predicted dithiol-disulfide oxidoreductase (DUF899 family)
MTNHAAGTREEWLAARLELLEAEKELTRRSDELARRRQELPWVQIDKEYRFETDEGTASLADLFGGRSQLLVYHFMFGPEYTAGCPSWASSFESDFNYDFHVSHTDDEWQSGAVEYNFRTVDFRPAEENPELANLASATGTDFATYRREGPGMSALAFEDGVVYLTYSAYERGIDILWGMQQWLDRAPLGRNETGIWWRRHDEYDSE